MGMEANRKRTADRAMQPGHITYSACLYRGHRVHIKYKLRTGGGQGQATSRTGTVHACTEVIEYIKHTNMKRTADRARSRSRNKGQRWSRSQK